MYIAFEIQSFAASIISWINSYVEIVSLAVAIILGVLAYIGIIKQIESSRDPHIAHLLFEMYKLFYSTDMLKRRALVAKIPFSTFESYQTLQEYLKQNPSYYQPLDELLTFFEMMAINFHKAGKGIKQKEVKKFFVYYAIGYWKHCEAYISGINESEKTNFYYKNYKEYFEDMKDTIMKDEEGFNSFLQSEKDCSLTVTA